jgi:hypothetical protein
LRDWKVTLLPMAARKPGLGRLNTSLVSSHTKHPTCKPPRWRHQSQFCPLTTLRQSVFIP